MDISSPANAMANTPDSLATLFTYYANATGTNPSIDIRIVSLQLFLSGVSIRESYQEILLLATV